MKLKNLFYFMKIQYSEKNILIQFTIIYYLFYLLYRHRIYIVVNKHKTKNDSTTNFVV